MPYSNRPSPSEKLAPKDREPDTHKETDRGTLQLPERRRELKPPHRSAHEPDQQHTGSHAKSGE